MKITDSNRFHEQNIKSENEIENVKKIYEQKIEAAKTEGEDRYLRSIKSNDEQLIGASKSYEDKLNNYQEQLKKTEKNIAKEELALKSAETQKLDNVKEQFNNNFSDRYAAATENLKSIQEQSRIGNQRIVNESRAEKDFLATTSRNQINALSSEYAQKGISTERDYKSTLENDLRSHQAEMNLQRAELKKVLDKTTEQNKKLEAEKIKVQNVELSNLDTHQKDVLTQKQNDFKIRYENLVKEHDTLLNQIKTQFEADVNKLALQSATQKRNIANKIEDQFYRVESLKPEISENEKEYMVSMKVPEHEHENVHLIVHGRGVKMTLSRKFTDSLEDSDGSTNKSSRSELFSKDFLSKDILDPKQIAQKYENGILSFKIQKL